MIWQAIALPSFADESGIKNPTVVYKQLDMRNLNRLNSRRPENLTLGNADIFDEDCKVWLIIDQV
jgi:hypothetical protein